MEIELQLVKLKDIFEGYIDTGVEGVEGYNGLLDIRPPYQREFIYDSKQQEAVIDSVIKGFPLGIFYWSKVHDENGTFLRYEVLDGQQRTLSLMKYMNGDFSVNYRNFHNLTTDEQEVIKEYEILVYVCDGTESEKLKWFSRINIAGEVLRKQELLNAVYAGSFVSDARKYFSKPSAPAKDKAGAYMSGQLLRQDYLEQVLKWISEGEVEEYLAEHQHDPDASHLWNYFNYVMTWAQTLFSVDRNELKSVEWGYLYNEFKDERYSVSELEEEVKSLMLDDDVTKKSGIYPYVLTHDERYLNIRSFSPQMKRETYERQNGICANCGEHFAFSKMEADHITPWSQGGKTNAENCQMLCRDCNRRKSAS